MLRTRLVSRLVVSRLVVSQLVVSTALLVLLGACSDSSSDSSNSAGGSTSTGATGAGSPVAGSSVASTAGGDATAPVAPNTTVLAGATTTSLAATTTVPARTDVYAAAGVGALSPAVAGARELIYVPTAKQGKGLVQVIDPATLKIIDTINAGSLAQHVVPSWDLRTLYVTASGSNQLLPIDPKTGVAGTPIKLDRPYNLYFTPDGKRAVVQTEQYDRLDYYDTTTWKLLKSVKSTCDGNNHADWSADGAYFVVTCEFSGELLKVDTASGEVIGKLSFGKGAMPQDVRLVPDGSKFYVADMQNDGVWIVDGVSMKVTGQIKTGRGAHGIYPSRDGTVMYVANRGRHMDEEGRASRAGDGGVSVVDPLTDTVRTTWTIPGGGSPDMGGVSADGKRLWLSGRYDAEVYVFDTTTGEVVGQVPTEQQPHGLLVWPQPGRYSLGHTGNMR